MAFFEEAAYYPFQSLYRRFTAAHEWAEHADIHRYKSALEAYNAALAILPQLTALSLNIQARQKFLTSASDRVARRAAKCAIRSGHLHKAVEYLETGRAVLWSQVLHLRSFDQLRDDIPQQAGFKERLNNIATALGFGSFWENLPRNIDNRLSDEETSRLSSLAKEIEWSGVLDNVRLLDGFEDFLLPRPFSSLQTAAKAHPVVILIPNDDGSDCLIMTSTDLHHISLPQLPSKTLRALALLTSLAASREQVPLSLIEPIEGVQAIFSPDLAEVLQDLGDSEPEWRGGCTASSNGKTSDDCFKQVLEFLWKELVKPVVDYLKFQKSTKMLPTLQWCPTGVFTLLPVHAAGRYNSKHSTECASDYFISTYTPTIGALLTPDPPPSTEPFKMMVVTQSLPEAKVELERIRRYVSAESLVTFGTPESNTSVEAVASCLPNPSIVHFACHGKQNPSNPLDGGFIIEDKLLTISRVMEEKMPNRSLAFLSACETATGDRNVPDEAMSLGASLLFSGFRRVVTTMWKISDEDGPTIADAFYEELSRSPDGERMSQPDCTRTALALDIAVKKLRSEGVSFRRWVPFIHMGK